MPQHVAIDDIDWDNSIQIQKDVVHYTIEHLRKSASRIAADVRGYYYVLQLQERMIGRRGFAFHDIKRRATKLSAAQGGHKAPSSIKAPREVLIR